MTMLQHGLVPSTGGYRIERSLRFNSADSAYLNRTPASASNRRTWTWSGWVKLSESSTGVLFAAEDAAGNASPYTAIYYINNRLELQRWGGSSYNIQVSTNNLLRDFSAWYHFVVAVDTTQATSANRVKLYINGVETSYNTATYPTQNFDTDVNFTQRHALGCLVRVSPNNFTGFSNQYLTEVNFIDGSTPTTTTRTVGGVTETVLTQFGEFDTDTGVWKPKAYSGSYGTNGFYLKFADNSGTTSTTLGKDSSGNGNNWTPNNFSVTAGAGNDSLVDTPTPYGTDTGAGGEVRGNYATLNPLDNGAPSSGLTLANGNLQLTGISSNWRAVRSTVAMSSGKWYCEATVTALSGTLYARVGLATSSAPLDTYLGFTAASWVYINTGNKSTNLSNESYGSSWTTNDVIGIAFDADAGTLTFYKNGVSQGQAFSGLTSGPYFFAVSVYDPQVMYFNFGQRPFAYTAPSGFKALCTQNLPTPTIGATATTRADDYFNTVLYTGNGSTQSIAGVGFQPDFTWIKSRSGVGDNNLTDAVRGATKTLFSNDPAFEYTLANGLTSFNSDGFSVGNNSGFNTNTTTYVAWNWKANGAGSSNTQGTITSTVSANTTAGFSIVTWTSNGSNTDGVGHGLGVTPSMIIYKQRGASSDWYVWMTNMISGTNPYLILNSTAASATLGTTYGSPSSTTISNFGFTNGATLVAYCFAPVAGYSAFGSYTGNGSTDGVFVYLGFKPAFLLIKRTDTSGENWWMLDSKRNTYNVLDKYLLASSSGAEGTATTHDWLSNGFKARSANTNENNGTYIYAAFAESPFKYSLAR